MFEQEIWKDIKGYEGLYQVSNIGRIKSLKKYHGKTENWIEREIILKPQISNTGYYRVRLSNKGVKVFSVHRLVAKAFIENPNDYKEVNHIDGNKINNCSINLEWCSRSQNEKHAYLTGLAKSTKRKKINQYDLNGNFIKEWDCIRLAEKELRISQSNIIYVCKGKRKSAGNFIWRYVNDNI